ncbi:hypothetical protein [Kordiimonas lacus]|uniref:Uncharacterized protein n=1 Tax=Kordiimonas lacus TaxID=637679 RepID=A0A1G6ZT95_9PROT|nr:hypothetical protein [Kordiimonas lacus]SDE05918.1 hypothetical protein SAMN04488071_1946 [Kordiimonas lacus]
MASEYDVDAVGKIDSANPYEAITHLYVRSYGDNLLPIPLDDAIDGIRCGRFVYYVKSGDKREALRIARSPYNKFYLTVRRDIHEPRTLLALPSPEAIAAANEDAHS